MKDQNVVTLKDIPQIEVDPGVRLHSASEEEIMRGLTSDIYFVRARDLLLEMGLSEAVVTAEIFSSRAGVLAGVDEALHLLRHRGVEVWSLDEGSSMAEREVIMRIRGPYTAFGVYETPLLGLLAGASGWATAARSIKEAAGERTVVCYGARHLHPAVAPVMERAAVIGGADACSCILGALLLGSSPIGTIPHAAFLIVGDTVELARAYDRFVPEDAPRIILVDTFKDETEEALRVASALGRRLSAIRLDTPGERGGVTTGLVKETRARLDLAGFNNVKIIVSGGLTPDRVSALAAAGADAFGVGSFISRAAAIDMTMDLKEVNGKAVGKRGRLPGLTENQRLERKI